MTNEQIWQAVLGEIELNLSRANFTTWFKHTFILNYNDEEIIIGVPNQFTQTWLENKYNPQILSTLENILNHKIKNIIYQIENKQNSLQDTSSSLNNTPKHTSQERTQAQSEKTLPHTNHGLNSRYTFDNFIVGKGNELAHAACQAVVNNPGSTYNPLFIYGGVGLGKTHLLQAIGNELFKKQEKVLYTTSEKFTNDYIYSIKNGRAKEFKNFYRNIDVFLIDDIQFMAGKDGTQEEFFHTFNELHQADKQIVITADRAPKTMIAVEKRLLSRFNQGMIVDIVQPDPETKIAILEKKCQEKKYTIIREILEYIAENVQNNIRELEGALTRIIAYHQFNNSTPTIDSTKNILSDLLAETQIKSTTPQDIMNAVSRFYNLQIKDLTGKTRKKEIVEPRQISIYLMRKELSTSYPTIGEALGGRDHTTAMHAFNKIEKEIKEKENKKIKQEIDSIKQIIYNNLNS